MSIINKLDNNLVNKIAAGEVIERPASVVKELIENSIDADSSKIVIEIKESGFSLIKIVDNGKGMDKNDARLCLERHATSKITSTEDLFKINTLGFRGEALASIAAISNLKLITKQPESRTAFQINAEGGRIYLDKEIGYQNGTTIEIKDLFFNVPARKKFLKNMRLEFANIVDVVSRYALIHPKIFFKLIHNKKDIFVSPGTSDWQGAIINIYGKDVAKNLLAVNYSDGIYEIMGFVSKPSLTRGDKNHQSIYVNNRYIKNPIITKGIYDAYHTLLFSHRHPIIVLNINIDPALIDVNVHPTKKEIRINREEEMRLAVEKAVRQALDTDILVPQDTDKQTQIFIEEVKFNRPKKKEYVVPDYNQKELLQRRVTVPSKPLSTHMQEDDYNNETLTQQAEKPTIRIIGQVHDCYIIIEDKEGIVLVDQHAAEERVNYEKFMDMYANKEIHTQSMLEPIHIELNPKDAAILNASLDRFTRVGFDISAFGHNSFIVRSLPLILGKLANKEAILELIDQVKALKKIEEESIIQKACKASIKQGDKMTESQIRKLYEDLLNTNLPYTCPHGRPTMIKMTKHELERKFKRTG